MKLALIACNVLIRDLSYCLFSSPNKVLTFFNEQQLHNTPDLLRVRLQEKIHEVEALNESFRDEQKFDAIIIGYGLCSNGIIGLKSETLPLVIPKCDDCIALFLGSQEKYLDVFGKNSGGIYWFSKTWMDYAYVPSKESQRKLYEKYVELYGEDNAQYLVDMEMGYTEKYDHAMFLKSELYSDLEEREFVKQSARDFGWNYSEHDINHNMMMDLVNGNWDNRFLICPAGRTVVAEHTGQKIQVE